MVTKIREIECQIVIVIMTDKGDHTRIFDLNEDHRGIETTVPDLLKEAKEWFKSKMESI